MSQSSEFGGELYHAIPLHYLPSLFAAGALYAQSVLRASPSTVSGVPVGIEARRTAKKRDRALGLADYVHLSPTAVTPLLADKFAKGYPHALLIFDADVVLKLPEIAVLPYNTKAWRTRACYVPVTDPGERGALLARYQEGRRLRSLEILVKYGLPLNCATKIAFVDDQERDAVARSVQGAEMRSRLVVEPSLFPVQGNTPAVHWVVIQDYLDRCHFEEHLPLPPVVPFD